MADYKPRSGKDRRTGTTPESRTPQQHAGAEQPHYHDKRINIFRMRDAEGKETWNFTNERRQGFADKKMGWPGTTAEFEQQLFDAKKQAKESLVKRGTTAAIERRIKERRNLKNVNPFPEELRTGIKRRQIDMQGGRKLTAKIKGKKGGLLGLGIAVGTALMEGKRAYDENESKEKQ